MERSTERRKEVEATILEKVGGAISAVKNAKHVDEVICALHSLAILLFPLDSSLLSDAIDECYRDQVLSAKVASANDREEWWQVFYRGAAFPALSRVMLFDVASSWLACFPFSARKQVYDVFFVDGLATEVVQTLVSCLQQKESNNDLDINAVQSNIERLLILHLLENDGVLQMASSFGSYRSSENVMTEQHKTDVSRVAQIITSIPDKVRLKAPTSLSSHMFFKKIIHQILSGAEEMENLNESKMDCYLKFAGETFSRICRRGSTDVLLSEVVPRVLKHVRTFLPSNTDSFLGDLVVLNHHSWYWLRIMETIRDPYVVEKISEELLHRLATEHANDIEAYWTLWILFHRIINQKPSVKSMFVDKFLLWKVFPISCLRWILQFAVLECPPEADAHKKLHNIRGLLDTAQHVAAVWCKNECVQSASVEQQAYLTAALGLCLEKMTREELDETKDVMQSVLQGVSCRLESPTHLVRKMASSIALAFSKVIDPKNPLYLDDSCTEETISWDFGLIDLEKGIVATSNSTEQGTDTSSTSLVLQKDSNHNHTRDNGVSNNMKGKQKTSSDFTLLDPDEIIDPATLNNGSESDEDDVGSENSDSSSDSSLQPYDLSDDDTDLRKNFSQLVDVVGALRKSDDADGVERALDVAEKLVRASPDELKHIAGELVRALVQVHCSDLAVEGEEDSAEEKRQRALVALVSTCPVQSLETLNKLLYSPNVDVSQRIMILDIMTDAAQELADGKTMKPKHQQRVLISATSESQPWFLPGNSGPPGAGSWKEVPTTATGTLLNWSNTYERDLPLRASQIKKRKTRRWSLRSVSTQQSHVELSHNKFPLYAAAFMLPAMEGFDKRRHGVDLLGRDFIVLGKLVYMLGVCMKCAAMHPEASALASPLLDMLRSREVCHHKEAYVRRAVLFAASCILVALHPSYVASALVEGNLEISRGLEWVRTFALHVAESDIDRDCYTMAMTCLQLHAEMALQASRAFESAETAFKAKSVDLHSNPSKVTIKIPSSSFNLKF